MSGTRSQQEAAGNSEPQLELEGVKQKHSLISFLQESPASHIEGTNILERIAFLIEIKDRKTLNALYRIVFTDPHISLQEKIGRMRVYLNLLEPEPVIASKVDLKPASPKASYGNYIIGSIVGLIGFGAAVAIMALVPVTSGVAAISLLGLLLQSLGKPLFFTALATGFVAMQAFFVAAAVLLGKIIDSFIPTNNAKISTGQQQTKLRDVLGVTDKKMEFAEEEGALLDKRAQSVCDPLAQTEQHISGKQPLCPPSP